MFSLSLLRCAAVAGHFAASAVASGCDGPVDFNPLAGKPPDGQVRTEWQLNYFGLAPSAVDLLLLMDATPSMYRKTPYLIDALLEHVRDQVVVPCRRPTGEMTYRSHHDEPCPAGTGLAWDEVWDLNIGVLSSSLGGPGEGGCPSFEGGQGLDDRAQLIPSVREGLLDPEGSGVLKWRRGSREQLAELLLNLRQQLEAIGSEGCAFPAPLESWYRFLVEPNPPDKSEVGSIDHVLLAQREAFLRPKSLVDIVVISDSDDCSVMQGGVVYEAEDLGPRLLDATLLPPPAAACADNPHDACCVSCLTPKLAPAGCDLSACAPGESLSAEQDPFELRCFDGRRRFGLDFLYPRERYVAGLSSSQIRDRETGRLVDNPLLRGGGTHRGINRGTGAVRLAIIAGVPWQDISDMTDPDLPFLTNPALSVPLTTGLNRWNILTGSRGGPTMPRPARSRSCLEDPEQSGCGAPPLPPLDPFLRKSVEPRPAGEQNPLSGDAVAWWDSGPPNEINGFELPPSGRVELQPSCVFYDEEQRLPEFCDAHTSSCLCMDGSAEPDLRCYDESRSNITHQQQWLSATPPIRLLEVAREFGDEAVLGTLCPPTTSAGRRFFDLRRRYLFAKSAPRPEGFTQPLTVGKDGSVPCLLFEITPVLDEFPSYQAETLDCASSGRLPPDERQQSSLRNYLSQRDSGSFLDNQVVCLLPPLKGDERQACIQGTGDFQRLPPGYCYIEAGGIDQEGRSLDPGTGVIAPWEHDQLLRVAGPDTPRTWSSTVRVCQDENLNLGAHRHDLNPPLPPPPPSIFPPDY